MVFLDAPQGRALAILLPAVTFLAHTTTFVALGATLSASSTTPWCAVYDLLAAGASALGLWGAIAKRKALVTVFASLHTMTLSIITLVLVANVLPLSTTDAFSTLARLRYDGDLEQRMCQELDDGFGWDATWFDQCRHSFQSLYTGAFWIGLAFVGAQWWAVAGVWCWLTTLSYATRAGERKADDEEAGRRAKEKYAFRGHHRKNHE